MNLSSSAIQATQSTLLAILAIKEGTFLTFQPKPLPPPPVRKA